MKRILIFVAIVLCVGLSSCQCADKPDIGPVEGEDEQAAVRPVTPAPSSSAAALRSA
jgi:uncharacterized membrane-anchored protein